MKYYDILWDADPAINQKLTNAVDQITLQARIFPQYGRYGNQNRSVENKRPLGFKFANDLENKINKILKKWKVLEYFEESTAGK